MYVKKIKEAREKECSKLWYTNQEKDCLPKVTSIPKFTPTIALALVTTPVDDNDDAFI